MGLFSLASYKNLFKENSFHENILNHSCPKGEIIFKCFSEIKDIGNFNLKILDGYDKKISFLNERFSYRIFLINLDNEIRDFLDISVNSPDEKKLIKHKIMRKIDYFLEEGKKGSLYFYIVKFYQPGGGDGRPIPEFTFSKAM